ncbi:hypothetical protein PHYBOEH_002485 [Phytophthora boehmeriae]|uniref:Uncharacterized protein n=1 Tax=Phytophthora boehmeriae TaxID=109152 RepID=A0A8T1WUE2_9STRA|nr:hypothetical protein PHYBOEH_002485 [Phytophthora boehmeriae]
MEAPASSGAAVSGLMQQLKSGEISKMQLFQQLAKLQSAPAGGIPILATPTSTTTTNPVPSLMRNDGLQAATRDGATNISPGFLFGGNSTSISPFSVTQPPPVPAQFLFGAPVAPLPLLTQPTVGASSFLTQAKPDHASIVAKPSATIVESDAELLATGVSHEKAKQFSVQEWMANKTRASASTQVSDALRHPFQQQAPPHIAESSVIGLCHGMEFNKRGGDIYDPFGLGAYETQQFQPAQYSYANTHQPSASRQTPISPGTFGFGHEVDRGEQQYLDFSEEFAGDLNGNHTSNGGQNGGKASGRGSNTDGQFHARVTRWKSQKDAIRENMKQQLLQSELNECTFTPKINPKSTKVVAKLRGQQPTTAANQGLSTSQAVSERLYQEADNYRIREELATKLKADEEAEIDRQCTFKPKINPNDKVRAKYMEAKTNLSPSMTAASREAEARELSECTFYPKVNGIKAEMVSAQLYLQQDIYERLSKPCCGGTEEENSSARGYGARRRSLSLFGDDEDRDSLDVGSPRPTRSQDDISVRPGGTGQHRPQSAPRLRQGPRSVDGEKSRRGAEEHSRQFKNFIERQKFHEQARHKRIEQTKQQLTPGYKPTINKKSLAMMENGRKGDFLARISSYALRKEHENIKKKAIRTMNPNYTFKPAINQTSAKRKPRSITELSRGDLLRRETTQRLMKLKMEQEEMASLTFRPQLSRMSERSEGKLKILSSPETYLQRIQQQSQAHTIKQRRAMQEKEMGEFAECTFKPRTIEAPAYVQRIARSVSLTKALRAQEQAAARAREKPEWK